MQARSGHTDTDVGTHSLICSHLHVVPVEQINALATSVPTTGLGL